MYFTYYCYQNPPENRPESLEPRILSVMGQLRRPEKSNTIAQRVLHAELMEVHRAIKNLYAQEVIDCTYDGRYFIDHRSANLDFLARDAGLPWRL